VILNIVFSIFLLYYKATVKGTNPKTKNKKLKKIKTQKGEKNYV